jgi:hypothetical protein
MPRDLSAAATEILAVAARENVPIRLVGGLAIHNRCPSAMVAPFARQYGDIDLVTTSRATKRVRKLLETLGYTSHVRFNTANAGERMLFWEASEAWRIDIFIDSFRMCHTIDLRSRLELDASTLTLADLLLTKLQIVELTDKDVRDIAVLMLDHPLTDTDKGINTRYLASSTAADWGLYHTVERSLVTASEHLPPVDEAQRTVLVERFTQLRHALTNARKTLRWQVRSRVGERLPWYESPETALRG